MRYIIHNSLQHELDARIKYIYDAMQLWCIPNYSSKNYTELITVPSNSIDCLFIVGHNNFVWPFINSQVINESTIIAITCISQFSKMPTNKTIYVSYQNEIKQSPIYDGAKYRMNFNPTESEIIFLNSSLLNISIEERLARSFTCIQK